MLKIPLALFLGFGLVLWKAERIKDAAPFARVVWTLILGSIASVIPWAVLVGLQFGIRITENHLVWFIHWIAN